MKQSVGPSPGHGPQLSDDIAAVVKGKWTDREGDSCGCSIEPRTCVEENDIPGGVFSFFSFSFTQIQSCH